ncbi:amastigote surface protein 4 [Trypanosoma cruzi]|nr:amastigote surface protein 4 [Trypanosoma cruzi]
MDKGKEPKEGVLKNAKEKTQVLEEVTSSDAEKKVDVSRPTTVVNGSDIYMLAGNYSWAYADNDRAVDWGLMLVKGHVSEENQKGKRIYWNDTYAIPWTYKGNQHSILKRLIGGGGSGVKMKDGTLVFPVEGKKEVDTQEDGKTVSLVLYLQGTESWTLSKEVPADGCSDPSVVEWKGKLMMMTACDDGRRRVYEIGDRGNSRTEALGTLSRVWASKQKGKDVKLVGSGFTTANIGGGDDNNRDVMLVTLPVYSKEKDNENEKGVLHLWLTDNTHIVDIGPVSEEDDDVAASSLLYKSVESGNQDKKEELIALYEKKKGGVEPSLGMVSVRLTEQLKRVREVLRTWKEVDGIVSKLCSTLLAQVTSTDNACSADKITEGLVGFFSGNFSDGTWKDEYLGVNATVKSGIGAEEKDNGVTFKGRGAWAEWPVGKQEENQLYHFANYNFTLVATVSIHGLPKEGSIPLIGAKVNDGDKNTVLLGLSYNNKEGKWRVLCGDGTTSEHSRTWEPGTTYHVAIVLQNGNQGSDCVDGQRVCESVQINWKNTESKGISHFFIGGDGGNAENTGGNEGVSVTVRNVLLYNRPLSSEEIAGLAKNNIPTSVAARTSSPAVSRPKRSSESLAGGATGFGTARHFGANGDGSTVCGSGLLPLILLLGLWGFAAL